MRAFGFSHPSILDWIWISPYIHSYFYAYAFRLILNFFYYYTLPLLNYFLSILIECNLGLSLGHDRLMINCTSHILSMYHDLILGLVE